MEELKIVGYGICIILIVIFVIVAILRIVFKTVMRVRRLLFHFKNDD